MKKIVLPLALVAASIIGLCGCKASQKTAEACQRLKDTKWELESLYTKPIDSTTYMTKPFIVFQQDGTYTGNLGCNTYFGSYYNKKSKLQLIYDGSTKRLCPNMDMEKEYLGALKKDISTFSIVDENTLILFAGKEEIFRFKNTGPYLPQENE